MVSHFLLPIPVKTKGPAAMLGCRKNLTNVIKRKKLSSRFIPYHKAQGDIEQFIKKNNALA